MLARCWLLLQWCLTLRCTALSPTEPGATDGCVAMVNTLQQQAKTVQQASKQQPRLAGLMCAGSWVASVQGRHQSTAVGHVWPSLQGDTTAVPTVQQDITCTSLLLLPIHHRLTRRQAPGIEPEQAGHLGLGICSLSSWQPGAQVQSLQDGRAIDSRCQLSAACRGPHALQQGSIPCPEHCPLSSVHMPWDTVPQTQAAGGVHQAWETIGTRLQLWEF